MPTFNRRLQGDAPITFEALTAILPGGVLVIPATGATTDPSLQGIVVAGDAALNCLGVSEQDAVPSALQAANTATAATYDTAYTGVDVSVPGYTTAVYPSAVGYLNYTLACAYGAKLACAVGGAVRPWLTADGPAAIIGTCVQPGGVSAAGRALARINVQ